MALNLPIGNNIVVYTGATDLALSSLANYNSAIISKVFAVSPNGLGYISGTPGSSFGVTTLKAAVGDVYNSYIFVVKQATSLSSAQFGLGTQLVATFPPSTTGFVSPIVILKASQAGIYDLDPATPASGVSAVSYAKGGSAVLLPVSLALGDKLLVTATTAGADGLVALIKQ